MSEDPHYLCLLGLAMQEGIKGEAEMRILSQYLHTKNQISLPEYSC